VSKKARALQTYEPAPDAKTEAVKAAIDAGVTAFEAHKEKLLTILCSAWHRGPKTGPFDAERTWRRLTFLAGTYFWRDRARREVLPAADRGKRLRKIAEILGEACRLLDEAAQDGPISDQHGAIKTSGMTPISMNNWRDRLCSFAFRTSSIKSSQICPV
jgi:hypothetical protein